MSFKPNDNDGLDYDDKKLQQPEHYLEGLKEYIKRHKNYWGESCSYTDKWRLSLEKKTNRHTTSDGFRWGWYWIMPLGTVVGYWDDGTSRDDLKDVDRVGWNSSAKLLVP